MGHSLPTVCEISFGLVKVSSRQDLLSSEILSLLGIRGWKNKVILLPISVPAQPSPNVGGGLDTN